MATEDLKAVKEGLDRIEAQTVAGARVVTPKQHMLDASDAERKNPKLHIRWLNEGDPAKVESRKAGGYVKLTAEQGGRSLGGAMALYGIPKEQYERELARTSKLTADRLRQHETEHRALAERMSEEIYNKTGRRVKPEDLFSSMVGS